MKSFQESGGPGTEKICVRTFWDRSWGPMGHRRPKIEVFGVWGVFGALFQAFLGREEQTTSFDQQFTHPLFPGLQFYLRAGTSALEIADEPLFDLRSLAHLDDGGASASRLKGAAERAGSRSQGWGGRCAERACAQTHATRTLDARHRLTYYMRQGSVRGYTEAAKDCPPLHMFRHLA